jgi:hypothetical protein
MSVMYIWFWSQVSLPAKFSAIIRPATISESAAAAPSVIVGSPTAPLAVVSASSGSPVSIPLAPIAPPQASVQAPVVVTSTLAVTPPPGLTLYQISVRCSTLSS